MAIRRYLAMTAGEMREKMEICGNTAWMACHFSPYGRGLSNLPRELPEGSLLIVDDITPIHNHDHEHIGLQLKATVEAHCCGGVLLDFQRSGYPGAGELARHLARVLPCPVATAEGYADRSNGPVFLSPVPCHIPLTEYLSFWSGREVWLEMALDGTVLTVREKGTEITPLPRPALKETGFEEKTLHCHYTIQEQETEVVVTLWRTRSDLEELLAEAEKLGVTTAVGLYQEFSAEYIL